MLAKKKVTSEESLVNFGDLGIYTGGFSLAEGNYLWLDLSVLLYRGFKGDLQERLGVMITMLDLADEAALADPDNEANHKKQFYSLGGKAHLSFAPSSTGKGLTVIPGAAGNLNNQTNWSFLLKSLAESGLPAGTFSNDVSVLEGIHVHMQNIDEPAERASFQSQTGDVQATARTPGKIAIVTEILEEGKPWEGTGGLPEAGTKKPAGKATAAKIAPKPAAKAKEKEPEVDATDLEAVALSGLSSFLEATPAGGPKVAVRMAAFKHVKDEYGDEAAQGVQELYSDDETMGALLGSLGYKVSGIKIVKA